MIHVHHKHGVNPEMLNCFFCNKPKGIAFYGAIGHTKRLALAEAGIPVGPDGEAPRNVVMDKEPCDQCQQYMGMGVILISVLEPALYEHRVATCHACKHRWNVAWPPLELNQQWSTPSCPQCHGSSTSAGPVQQADDPQNPYRTGGWVVVTEDFVQRVLTPKEISDRIIKLRMAFVPDEAWDLLGLPRGASKDGGTGG